MTNERAVEILNLDLDILGQYGGETAEAYKMAIQALEAQPSEDCISREAVIRLVEQYPNIIGNRCSGLIADIKHLPSVTPSYNSIKTELKPCEDCISREHAKQFLYYEIEHLHDDSLYDCFARIIDDMYNELPSVKPTYTDEEIDKAQAVEQAYVDKMVELAVEEAKRPKGKWIETPVENDIVPVVFKCSECGMRVVNPYKYCPNCGAEMNGGGEDEASD